MTVGQNSFKVVPLLLLFYINYAPITCQNCGLPNVLRVSDTIKENIDTGQKILSETVRNLVSVSVVDSTSKDFVNITLTPPSSDPGFPALEMLLSVGEPLWKQGSDETSVVDFKRLNEINVTLELGCCDGRKKNVTVIIPVQDMNTECPKFNQENYNLITERCTLERCVLVFSEDIIVIDKDKDKRNAETVLWTNRGDIVNFLHNYSIDEPWYDDNNYGGKTERGYQSKLKLEFVPREDIPGEMESITFTMFANNTKLSANGTVMIGHANVTVTFEKNLHRLTKPEFPHSIYYVTVFSENGSIYTEPTDISANTNYVEGADAPAIQYIIQGEPEIFDINENTGELKLRDDFDIKNIVQSIPTMAGALTYKVVAVRNGTSIGDVSAMSVSSSVPVIALFPDYSQCSSFTPPEIVTSTMPVCTDPEECPSSSTTPSFTESQSTTDPWTTTPTTTTPTTTTPTTTTPTTTTPTTTTPTTTTPTTTTPTFTTTTPTTPTTTTPTTTTPTTTTPTTTTPTTTTPTSTSTITPVVTYPEHTSLPPTATEPSESTENPVISPPPPGECTCDCHEFTCHSPQVEPSLVGIDRTYYRDPYNCSIYHICYNDTFHVYKQTKRTFACPPRTVFCSKMTACTTVEMCLRETFPGRPYPPIFSHGYGYGNPIEEEKCENCTCNIGIPPNHPENNCGDENRNNTIPVPDPNLMDMFHLCQEEDPQEGDGFSYIDYPMQCQPGLVFCTNSNQCGYHDDNDCHYDDSLTFKQCDLCKMGYWKNFNIFTKTFNRT